MKGKLLAEARALHGRYAWEKVLAEMGVSRRTASNYSNLFLFWLYHRTLYERFSVLGPTKLYRLARVAPNVLKGMTLQTPVRTKDGMVLLGKATDRQLESFLKETFPPQVRSRQDKLRDAARKINALTANWPDHEPLGGETLEFAAVAVRTAAQLLASMSTRPATADSDATRRREGPEPRKPGSSAAPATG